MSLERYPWLTPLWQQLLGQLRQGRLPQGLLLTGPSGVGKVALARQLAQRWLCQGNEELPCGRCQSCQLWAAGSHPDFRLLKPEDNGRIGIDEVRSLQQQLATTAYLGGRRVVVIDNAAQMTDNAANALLKTLEEPPSGTLLLLTAARRESLLATIISRCQHWPLPQPEGTAVRALIDTSTAEGAELSALCAHAPLMALALLAQPQWLPAATAFLQWRRDGRHSGALADLLIKQGPSVAAMLWQLAAAEWPLASRSAALEVLARTVAALQLPGRNLSLAIHQLLAELAPLRQRSATHPATGVSSWVR